MSIKNGYLGGLMLLLACLAVTAVSLLLPVEVSCDASGCSRFDNAAPSYYGCSPSPGSACYECNYSEGGEAYTCYEDGSGGLKYCLDYQY